MVATAITTAAADYVDYARLANANLLTSLPVGKYSTLHLQDGESIVFFPPGVQPAIAEEVEAGTVPSED